MKPGQDLKTVPLIDPRSNYPRAETRNPETGEALESMTPGKRIVLIALTTISAFMILYHVVRALTGLIS